MRCPVVKCPVARCPVVRYPVARCPVVRCPVLRRDGLCLMLEASCLRCRAYFAMRSHA